MVVARPVSGSATGLPSNAILPVLVAAPVDAAAPARLFAIGFLPLRDLAAVPALSLLRASTLGLLPPRGLLPLCLLALRRRPARLSALGLRARCQGPLGSPPLHRLAVLAPLSYSALVASLLLQSLLPPLGCLPLGGLAVLAPLSCSALVASLFLQSLLPCLGGSCLLAALLSWLVRLLLFALLFLEALLAALLCGPVLAALLTQPLLPPLGGRALVAKLLLQPLVAALLGRTVLTPLLTQPFQPLLGSRALVAKLLPQPLLSRVLAPLLASADRPTLVPLLERAPRPGLPGRAHPHGVAAHIPERRQAIALIVAPVAHRLAAPKVILPPPEVVTLPAPGTRLGAVAVPVRPGVELAIAPSDRPRSPPVIVPVLVIVVIAPELVDEQS